MADPVRKINVISTSWNAPAPKATQDRLDIREIAPCVAHFLRGGYLITRQTLQDWLMRTKKAVAPGDGSPYFTREMFEKAQTLFPSTFQSGLSFPEFKSYLLYHRQKNRRPNPYCSVPQIPVETITLAPKTIRAKKQPPKDDVPKPEEPPAPAVAEKDPSSGPPVGICPVPRDITVLPPLALQWSTEKLLPVTLPPGTDSRQSSGAEGQNEKPVEEVATLVERIRRETLPGSVKPDLLQTPGGLGGGVSVQAPLFDDLFFMVVSPKDAPSHQAANIEIKKQLDATREARYAQRQRELDGQLKLEETYSPLRGSLRAIYESPVLSWEEKRERIFESWDGCYDVPENPVRTLTTHEKMGQIARGIVIAFIRARFPKGSPLQYTPEEIGRLNGKRMFSKSRFAPYGAG